MREGRSIVQAILAAALYALSAPLSKLLLEDVSATLLAGLLYLGAGAGTAVVGLFRRRFGKTVPTRFVRSDRPYLVLMVLLDVAAPILLLSGLRLTTAANASLLNNFEIVATSLFALFAFREVITRRVWAGIVLVTIASIVLSFSAGAFAFAPGSLLILAAATCWGLENNCTRLLSTKDPLAVVVVKGFGAGVTAVVIAFALGEASVGFATLAAALALGFVAYGLSIWLYVSAQRHLGAAKTAAWYAVAPFVGAGLSLAIFRIAPAWNFYVALALLAAGAWLTTPDLRKTAKP